MKTRTGINIFIGAFFIALLLWLGAYAYRNIIVVSGNPATPTLSMEGESGTMTAFLVANGNFIADGSKLGKVEVWAVLADASSSGGQRLLGTAALQAGSDPMVQIWALPIPKDPVPAVEIFAKGFDANGVLVGQLSLPYLGAHQVFDAIWAPRPAAISSNSPDVQRHFSFGLAVGEKITVGGLTVKLLKIESDSRCPRTAVCIWAGEVAAKVQFVAGSRDETVTLHSMSVPSAFANYQVGITGVAPARSGTLPAQSDYRVTFSVERM